ncbi:peroxiredoxin [Halalkaliarchaeum desulfuricum]|uniref:Peroxiredoxin n=1 Tax=Halalkaliarchaeum desulfuricum TaxID=2055893 RepID=A0A343TFI7_9EURY|nr:redoxin domain-containing protein [Halalkaliarchaeum desulfuricum]AUX07859.1 peroxiredoxin [Halalkaliarchaeum desulfuricum]
MVSVGDTAPDIVGSLADGDLSKFTLEEHLGDGPVVLAFFPAAFSSTCTDEFCRFRDEFSTFAEVDATVFGVSTDLPFALNAFREEHDLPFGLVSDTDASAVDAYGVRDSFDGIGVPTVAGRAVFVLDEAGTITYSWIADDSSLEPPYEEVEDAVASAADRTDG